MERAWQLSKSDVARSSVKGRKTYKNSSRFDKLPNAGGIVPLKCIVMMPLHKAHTCVAEQNMTTSEVQIDASIKRTYNDPVSPVSSLSAEGIVPVN